MPNNYICESFESMFKYIPAYKKNHNIISCNDYINLHDDVLHINNCGQQNHLMNSYGIEQHTLYHKTRPC